MGLTRILFWITVAALLWLVPGCGDSSASSSSVWGGVAEVSADRAELRNVRWKDIPPWEEWAALPQKSQIVIQGEWQIAGGSESVSFQCRLSRQSDSLYKLNFTAGDSGRALTAAGEIDWVRRSAALDFYGGFSAGQYRTYFGTVPELKHGAADVRGSMLLSADKVSFPVLTIVPAEKSILQLGCLPLSGGRMERRETFRGKLEFFMSDMFAHAGGIKLLPYEAVVDRENAVFKTKVEPDRPWQSSVPLQGEMLCPLAEDGEWSLTAELPEAGVFRRGDLILPLRSCLLNGRGTPQGGKWSFLGEGASGSLLQSAGNITASNVLIRGEKTFLFADADSVFQPDSFQMECGKIEFPYLQGRISSTRFKGEFRHLPSGCLQVTGNAGEVGFAGKDGTGLRFVEPVWDLPLLHVGGKIFSPEAGTIRAKKLLLTSSAWNAELENLQSSVTLKEHSWDAEVTSANVKLVSGGLKVVLSEAAMKFSGSRKSGGMVEFAGKGRKAGIQFAEWSGEGGAWDCHAGLSADLTGCNFISLSGSSWRGKYSSAGMWDAEKFAVKADYKNNNRWSGRFSLAGGNFIQQGLAVKGVTGQLPFGGADAAGEKIKADLIKYKALTLTNTVLDLQNSADGVSLRGRGRSELTGGACFITGDIRNDLCEGAVEYSMPMATLQHELKTADLLPLPGGWIFSGKLGGTGKVLWKESLPVWQSKYTFTGFARNAACMVEDLSGQIEPVNGEIADGRLLFSRLTSVAGEGTAGELQFRTEKQRMILQDARFDAWGGHWKYIRNGEFQVKGIQPGGLLALPAWQNAVQGNFSGSITLDDSFNVRLAELKSDSAGSLVLTELEKFQLLPKKEFDMNALAFTTAVFRDFRYNALSLRVIRRKSNVLLRVTGEGRPAKAVPFVLEKDGLFRTAVGSEHGFDGNVEVGCGYRIPLRDLAPQTGK